MAKVCMKRSSISLVLEKKCYLKALHVPIGKAKKKKKKSMKPRNSKYWQGCGSSLEVQNRTVMLESGTT